MAMAAMNNVLVRRDLIKHEIEYIQSELLRYIGYRRYYTCSLRC